jgi:ABC-type Fe3+/spermidine/putrescine transport system ATPase subunit
VQEVKDGQARIDAGPLGNLSALDRSRNLSPGQNLLAAIRPEKITLSAEEPTSTNFVKGVLDTAAYLGDRSHFYVRVDGVEKPIAVSTQNLNQVQFGAENKQRQVWLNWSNDAIVLLPAD